MYSDKASELFLWKYILEEWSFEIYALSIFFLYIIVSVYLPAHK